MALLDFLRRATRHDSAAPYTVCPRCRHQVIDDRHYAATSTEVASANYDAARAVDVGRSSSRDTTARRVQGRHRRASDYDWGWR